MLRTVAVGRRLEKEPEKRFSGIEYSKEGRDTMKINRTSTAGAFLLGLVALGAPSVQALPEVQVSTETKIVLMAKTAVKPKPAKEVSLPQLDDMAIADRTAKPKPKPRPGPRDDGDGD
ncbi:MAG TPA: hypothetical protein VM821_07615 [Abditibacteriaceae bacterium]|jgi:hypothetical protein|nr:hypothetical protein [Abditibacteriaceae bacterium]